MKTILGLVIFAFATMPAAAGVRYEIESSFGGETVQTGIVVEGMNMKMDPSMSTSTWDGDMIFRAAEREMIVVNHDDRSYFVFDQEQMKKLASTMNQAMASMEQALSAMPESQRARMEEMMKSRMPAMAEPREPSELKKTGAADTVNGFDCEIYEVWRSGIRERELCVTDWDNVAGGNEVAEIFYEMGEFMSEMLDSLPKMGNGGAIGDATYEHMKEMNGFPVRTREFGDDGILDGQSTLLSSATADFDAADFEPPKKYKRKDLMKGIK
ncbi:MAG: DUF4412 domain-containing protein [Thermoanaerobaculales bacterium]|jgi:hypothetical protein|nr:DUF4412 domain-containing protein [Thermoanaerobaculales bacterium]